MTLMTQIFLGCGEGLFLGARGLYAVAAVHHVHCELPSGLQHAAGWDALVYSEDAGGILAGDLVPSIVA